MRSLIRQTPAEAPRDPAPSRLTYRYQRLMLTPGFRAAVRIGVPILLILTVWLLVGWVFAQGLTFSAALLEWMERQYGVEARDRVVALQALVELNELPFEVVDAGALNLRRLRGFVGAAVERIPLGLPGLHVLLGLFQRLP